MLSPVFRAGRVVHLRGRAPPVPLLVYDSWAGRSQSSLPSRYRTILALHGVCFNSKIWNATVERWPSNVRFVAYNQRGYEGSAPSLAGSGLAPAKMTEEYIEDLSELFEYVVKSLNLPPCAQGGGLTLLGWSKGNAPVLGLLSRMLEGSLPLSSVLGTHLRSAILFEPPGSLLGRRATPDLASARGPRGTPPAEAAQHFLRWAASTPSSSSKPDPAPPSAELLENARLAFEPDNLAHGFEWPLSPDTARAAMARAPVPLGLLIGDATQLYFTDAAEATVRLWSEVERDASGLEPRRIVKTLAGGNHCAMVDRSAEFAAAIVDLVVALDLVETAKL